MTTYYDPMIAKLVVWAPNRKMSLQKLHSSLSQYQVSSCDCHITKPVCVGLNKLRYIIISWQTMSRSSLVQRSSPVIALATSLFYCMYTFFFAFLFSAFLFSAFYILCIKILHCVLSSNLFHSRKFLIFDLMLLAHCLQSP